MTIDTIPGEPNASMISSIINLICPQCGGGMMNSNAAAGAVETGSRNGSGRSVRRGDQPPGSCARHTGPVNLCTRLAR